MATYFELTSLAHVKFPPHEPSIVAKSPLYYAQLRYFISTLVICSVFSCNYIGWSLRLLHLLNYNAEFLAIYIQNAVTIVLALHLSSYFTKQTVKVVTI